MVRRSSYLLLVLALVALVLAVVTLVDYQFSALVEVTWPDVDARTAVIGRVYASVSAGTFVLHAVTGPILRLAGVPLVLLAIPALLLAGLGAFAALPRFATAALVKVAGKAFDYTIFRSAKEILYIPLSYAEQTQGKSVVDMLTYRVAKGGASLLLMGLLALGLAAAVTPVALALTAAWLGTTVAVVRRFRRKVPRSEELRGG